MEEIIANVIGNFPNFAGFALLSLVLWLINQAQERMVVQRLERMDKQLDEAVQTERWLTETLIECWKAPKQP